MKGVWKIACALLLSGSVFFYGGCFGTRRVPENVSVEGVEVGGMTFGEAERAVKSRIAEELPPITVKTPYGNYTFRYPELSFTDNVCELLQRAHTGESLHAEVRRTWADLEREAEHICKENARDGQDATLSFTADGFSYTHESDGVVCEYEKLTEDLERALGNGGTEVSLAVRTRTPSLTERVLRERTQLISSFTTYFDGQNEPRVENIRLSAARIAGTVLLPGEEFSFNGVVGLRTEENGYKIATVIQNGQFADGIGGGVCQTSTTLFNAALLAGMRITESRAHSLSIGYVEPSLDAMVSEFSDLKFVNPREYPVYLLSRVGGEEITFEFYGAPNGEHYETESVTLMEMQPPPPQIVEGDEEKAIRAEKGGLASESFLLRYDDAGNLLSRERIRRDSYATVQGIYQILPE